MAAFPFRRVLIATPSASVDLELLRYGAQMAALGPGGQVVVGLPPTPDHEHPADVSLDQVRALAPGMTASHLPLAGVDADSLCAGTRDARADVLITRHPLRWPGGPAIVRRLIDGCAAPVWLVPAGARVPIRRVVAERARPGREAAFTCAQAVSLSASAALLDPATTSDDGPSAMRSLIDAATRHDADLLVVNRRHPGPDAHDQSGADIDDLCALTATALLVVPPASAPPSGWRALARFGRRS